MLRLESVSVAYGKHEALHEVSLSVTAGETTAIPGTNGAGKTTMLNAIVGLVRPRPGGRILFEGRPIESEPTHRIVESGVALVPELAIPRSGVDPSVTLCRTQCQDPVRRIGVAVLRNRYRPPAAQAVLETVERTCATWAARRPSLVSA